MVGWIIFILCFQQNGKWNRSLYNLEEHVGHLYVSSFCIYNIYIYITVIYYIYKYVYTYSLRMYVHNDHLMSSPIIPSPLRWFLSICEVNQPGVSSLWSSAFVESWSRVISWQGSWVAFSPCFTQVPYSASDCKTLDELEAWHHRLLLRLSSGIWICEIGSLKFLDNVLQYVKAMWTRAFPHEWS